MMIKVPEKMAESVIDGLKAQPLALPLVVVNALALGIVGYVLYVVAERGEARDALITKLATECRIEKP